MKYALPILLLLTFVTGYIDALAFVGYGHVFTANMSGNTVLLGITLVQLVHPLGLSEGPAGHALSIASFAAGVALGTVFLRAGLTPRRAALLIFAEAALVALAFFLRHAALLPVIPLALAAGAQSMLAARTGIPGISTAYVTGTIVKTVSTLLDRDRPNHLEDGGHSGSAWLAYGIGALAGAAAFLLIKETALLPAAGAFLVLAFFAGRG